MPERNPTRRVSREGRLGEFFNALLSCPINLPLTKNPTISLYVRLSIGGLVTEKHKAHNRRERGRERERLGVDRKKMEMTLKFK